MRFTITDVQLTEKNDVQVIVDYNDGSFSAKHQFTFASTETVENCLADIRFQAEIYKASLVVVPALEKTLVVGYSEVI